MFLLAEPSPQAAEEISPPAYTLGRRASRAAQPADPLVIARR
jgi:hypothetical protein